MGRFEAGRNDDEVGVAGAALLSNTTVCEASRLLRGASGDDDPIAAMRVNDLLSLIDATVLYERLHFLPASLPGDLEELQLRIDLLDEGVLQPFPKASDQAVLANALLGALSTETYADYDGQPVEFDEVRHDLATDLGVDSSADVPEPRPLVEGVDEALYFGGSAAGSGAGSFREAANAVISGIWYGASGSYEHASSGLRAMYYVFAADHYQLPYVPSVSARPIERNFPNYFDGSARKEIYEQLATALKTTAAKVRRAGESTMFVPPFAALVLDRASNREQIGVETLALREEFADLRAKLRELERQHAEARSLDERTRVLGQIERLCKEVTRPFEQPAELKLEASLRYIPDVVELAANPTNPVSWARLLLDKPAEALIAWNRRRPVAKLVKVARDVKAMRDYSTLLAKHFGGATATQVVERLAQPG
jgi:hypothetical protein